MSEKNTEPQPALPCCPRCLSAKKAHGQIKKELNLAISGQQFGPYNGALIYCADCGAIITVQLIGQKQERPLIEIPGIRPMN